MSPEENSYNFLLCPKMMTATSTEHSTESSCAFLNSPPLRLRNVLDLNDQSELLLDHMPGPTYTALFLSSLIALISIFRRPILYDRKH